MLALFRIVVVVTICGLTLFAVLSAGANAAYYRQTEQEWNPDDVRNARNRMPGIILFALIVLIALGFFQPGAFGW